MIFFDELDWAAVKFWTKMGYKSAQADIEDEKLGTDDELFRHLCFYEFTQDIHLVGQEGFELDRYLRLKPFLLRAFVGGYRSYVNNEEANF